MDELDEWEINCDICGLESIIHSIDPPDFCPMCGRRAIPVLNNPEPVGYLEDE